MKYQIDQSGKVEYTSRDTVVAIANGNKKAILIKAKDKRYIQKIFRQMGKSQLFVIRLFSILVFLLVKKGHYRNLIIDTEYPGWEALIKNYLLNDLDKHGIDKNTVNITFQPVGKSCEAHWHAYYVFKRKRKAEITVTAREVLNVLFH